MKYIGLQEIHCHSTLKSRRVAVISKIAIDLKINIYINIERYGATCKYSGGFVSFVSIFLSLI